MMRILLSLLAAALIAGGPTAGYSHEFWLAPHAYQVPTDQPIVADIRVGEAFSGPAYSYLPGNFTRFDIVTASDTKAVQGRMGDKPALSQLAGPGLAVIVHETTDLTVRYSQWPKFVNFTTHKDYPDLPAQHLARGLPRTGFSESYRRYAKSLVAVGHGRGQDAPQGLEVEIVALANPYTDSLPDGLPVQVLYQDSPRAHSQLEVFDKAPDATVTVTRLRTDDQGRVTVPVQTGHEYLLDSVVLRPTENDDPANGPVWHSLWASMTFRMP